MFVRSDQYLEKMKVLWLTNTTIASCIANIIHDVIA